MQAGMVLRFDPGDDAWEGDIPGCFFKGLSGYRVGGQRLGQDRAGAVKSPGRRDTGL